MIHNATPVAENTQHKVNIMKALISSQLCFKKRKSTYFSAILGVFLARRVTMVLLFNILYLPYN